MPSYNTRIVREGGGPDGASKMNFASGASFVGASGAVNDWSAGRSIFGTVDSIGTLGAFAVPVAGTAACIAASKLKLGTDLAASATGANGGVFEVLDIGNGIKFFIGHTQDAPSANASPGSFILRLPSTGTPASVVGLYMKTGDNNPGSANWVSFQTSASAG